MSLITLSGTTRGDSEEAIVAPSPVDRESSPEEHGGQALLDGGAKAGAMGRSGGGRESRRVGPLDVSVWELRMVAWPEWEFAEQTGPPRKSPRVSCCVHFVKELATFVTQAA